MNGEQHFKCPECPKRGKGPDRKKHLSVNVSKGVLHCFRCGFGKGVNAERYCQEHNLDVDGEWGTWSPINRTLQPLRLPNEYTTDFTKKTLFGPETLQYLLKRGLSRELIAAYDIGHCPSGTHHHRIILPVYENGILVNFQGRDWSGVQEPKYLGPFEHHGKPDTDAMFNLPRAARSGVVVLVEGIFDALRLPDHAVALLGKGGWTAAKHSRLLAAKPVCVYLCLDDDAREEEQQIHEDLAGCIPHVETIKLAAHDLGSAGTAEMVRVRRLCKAAATAARAFAAAS